MTTYMEPHLTTDPLSLLQQVRLTAHQAQELSEHLTSLVRDVEPTIEGSDYGIFVAVYRAEDPIAS